MLMISGILMNIPGDLYESATIDGASKPRMFFSITLPYIMQVCTPYLISSLVSNINNFNVIYLLTMDTVDPDATYGKLSARQSDLLITWLYNMISSGSSPRYYLGSIIGIIMFAVSTIFTLIAFNISQRNAAKKGA
jgi:arabinogalactan oligomer/maltooligosaccharide transport system permease protein